MLGETNQHTAKVRRKREIEATLREAVQKTGITALPNLIW